ncbi:MAG: hypothetical protein FRX48_07798 [Lasallia pustulata]|uniref:Uncharacterized protein n=1 Tax=Lasallia pustulata TaxID=136370 RepID=A0A5M8PIP0_9LECA|nr:MAG: hypothetical protein FRX48_07798 [Lasallia pustulata]
MALIISLSAFAVFVPSTFAQSSGFLRASSRNMTVTGVPHFLSNSTLSYGPTARPSPMGLITSYFDLTSTVESAEGSCGQATVTETAYQTITVTVTPPQVMTKQPSQRHPPLRGILNTLPRKLPHIPSHTLIRPAYTETQPTGLELRYQQARDWAN